MPELSKEFFRDMGYATSRQLDDGTWVGLVPLLFTTGICIGLDEIGWEKRYCFEDKLKCIQEYDKLRTHDDIPMGWVAKRSSE